ncbi:MAG: hypothetical protein FWH04_09740 [Oscillospiraceae bacterium]|nr:hypothetical protein [Oscillospiraceae bacterium]
MDDMYEAMLDLVGSHPSGSGKISFRDMALCSFSTGATQHAHIDARRICWRTPTSVLRTIQGSTETNWQLQSTPHEIGHLFHNYHTWVYEQEEWAGGLAFLAGHKIGQKFQGFNLMDNLADWQKFYDEAGYGDEYTFEDDFPKFVTALFRNDPQDLSKWDNDSFERGWGVLQQVFRSYSGTLSGAPNRDRTPFDTNKYNKLLVEFVEKIAKHLGMSADAYVDTYCPKIAKIRWAEINGRPISSGNYTVPAIEEGDTHFIDLENETLTVPGGFTIGAYSLNGVKWKVIKEENRAQTHEKNPFNHNGKKGKNNFSKILNKGSTLHLAERYDKSTKQATGKVVKFPAIDKRPKKNPEKLGPLYNTDNNTWSLRVKKGGAAPQAVYEWANTTDKKTPSSMWSTLSGSLPTPSGKDKVTYLFRTPPKADHAAKSYVPVSKVLKVTAKAPKVPK